MKKLVVMSVWFGVGMITGLFATGVQPAAADEGIVCAAVYACQADGSVDPRFSSGSCANFYAAQCRESKIIDSCSNEITALERKNRKLEKKLRAEQRRRKSR